MHACNAAFARIQGPNNAQQVSLGASGAIARGIDGNHWLKSIQSRPGLRGKLFRQL